MKLDETRLSRAFTDASGDLNDAVEAAFRRGEQAMKKRHKWTIALSAVAACALIFAALALAAGKLTAPRPDPVVASRGGGTIAATGTPQPTPLPDELPEPTPELSSETVYYYTENGRYYHTDPTCSGMRGAAPHTPELALASGKQPCPVCVWDAGRTVLLSDETAGNAATGRMTAQEAWEKLLEVDPTAGKVGQVWLYLSSEAKAAWAFCAYAKGSDEALRKGSAWFIGENECVCLGLSESVESWFFFTQHPGPDPVSEEPNALEPQAGNYVAYGRELFSSRIRKGKTTVAHFWMVREDGLPVELDTGSGLSSAEVFNGVLTGRRNTADNDWVFLYAHDELYQVTAQPVSIEDAAAQPNVQNTIMELEDIGYTVTDCLYRNMDQLGSGAAVLTVNLEQGGEAFHTYLFRSGYDEQFVALWGWDDINVYPGKGTINPDAGLPTLSSGTLATDSMLQSWSRQSASQDVEAPVYYTAGDVYYHGNQNCSGMRDAERHTLAEAEANGKLRCPVCQPGEPDHYDLFLAAFGQGLEVLCPGYTYAYRGDETDFFGDDCWFVTDGEKYVRVCHIGNFLKADGGVDSIYSYLQTLLDDVFCISFYSENLDNLWSFLSDAEVGGIALAEKDEAVERLIEKSSVEVPLKLEETSVWVAIGSDGVIREMEVYFNDVSNAVSVTLGWTLVDGEYVPSGAVE